MQTPRDWVIQCNIVLEEPSAVLEMIIVRLQNNTVASWNELSESVWHLVALDQ